MFFSFCVDVILPVLRQPSERLYVCLECWELLVQAVSPLRDALTDDKKLGFDDVNFFRMLSVGATVSPRDVKASKEFDHGSDGRFVDFVVGNDVPQGGKLVVDNVHGVVGVDEKR